MNLKFINSLFLSSVWIGVLSSIVTCVNGQTIRPASDGRKLTNGEKATKVDTMNLSVIFKTKYTAEDSIRFDRARNVVYLYGKAHVVYGDFELDADYIALDQTNNTVFGKGYLDPKTNRYRGKPIFKQQNEEPILTDSLIFNYKTGKGKSYGTFSNQGEGYLQAKEFKKNEFNEGFFRDGMYTTCNLSHPHFGIRISKGIVDEKRIVAGPFYLEVEDTPSPLGLPFGVFPKMNRQTSGLIFPSFTEDANRGFLVKDLGYYLNISDYWDLAVKGSFYSKGSYLGDLATRYEKRYKHSGNFTVSYAKTYDPSKVEGTKQAIPSKDFRVHWRHTQRPEANPGTTFSASVDAGSSGYAQNTAAGGTYDVTLITQNTLASSISYGKTLGLFNLTLGATHNQDLLKRSVNLTLPSFSFGLGSPISPLSKVGPPGGQKWYQKATIGYSLQGTNAVNTTDTLLFKSGFLRRFNNGIQHSVPINVSLNVFNYFQFTPRVDYTERWYLQTIRKRYIPTTNAVVIDTVPGFTRAYNYSFSSGVSTQLFGQVNFKRGKIVALRHVVKPAINFNYTPDFSSDKYGYYRTIEVPSGVAQLPKYSIFEKSAYGGPSSGKVASIGFSLWNNLELKKKAKSDTTNTSKAATNFDKISIIRDLTFSGNYNFAADSLRLSVINFNGSTALFKQVLTVNVDGTFDPYKMNANGTRINEYNFKTGSIMRLTRIALTLGLNLNSNSFKNDRRKTSNTLDNMTQQQADDLAQISKDSNAFVDFNIPWNLSASYNLQRSQSGLNTNIVSSLNFSGDLRLTPHWKVEFKSGYDFKAKSFTLPQFTFYRDLHCWDLSFSWIPSGPYRNYTVDLKVKASVLQDLKLNKRRNFTTNF